MWPVVSKFSASWMPSRPFSWLSVTGIVPTVVVARVVGFHIWTRPSSSM